MILSVFMIRASKDLITLDMWIFHSGYCVIICQALLFRFLYIVRHNCQSSVWNTVSSFGHARLIKNQSSEATTDHIRLVCKCLSVNHVKRCLRWDFPINTMTFIALFYLALCNCYVYGIPFLSYPYSAPQFFTLYTNIASSCLFCTRRMQF